MRSTDSIDCCIAAVFSAAIISGDFGESIVDSFDYYFFIRFIYPALHVQGRDDSVDTITNRVDLSQAVTTSMNASSLGTMS